MYNNIEKQSNVNRYVEMLKNGRTTVFSCMADVGSVGVKFTCRTEV